MSTTADCWPYTTATRCGYCGQIHNWDAACPTPGYSEKDEVYGWVCPRCGKVHAPHIPACDCPLPSGVSTTGDVTYVHTH